MLNYVGYENGREEILEVHLEKIIAVYML